MRGILISIQRIASPIALATFACFASTSLRTTPLRAQVSAPDPQQVAIDPEPEAELEAQSSSSPPGSSSSMSTGAALDQPAQEPDDSSLMSSSGSSSDDAAQTALNPGPATATPPNAGAGGPPLQTLALPTGADKSGVTSKTISVPKGSGTIQGMGESFSAQLSTGIATFSVPFALPAARGGAQPSLGLSYSSSGGFGVAGVGWQVGVPFIARQTDRGVPRYDDQAGWHPEQDRFVFNGGQELVPICVVSNGSCSGALANEVMPPWADGYQYFRPRVEGSFLRFFWKSDHLTWRVQDKSGVAMELGVPLNETTYSDALERNPDKQSEIYRWHLVRQYDTWGNANPAPGVPTPRNVIVYRYFQDGGTAYLSDIYDTPPKVGAETAALAQYAHHTRLAYEVRTDPTHSYRTGWRIDQRLRLARVDVSSKMQPQFAGFALARRMVRRYHLEYDATVHSSLLTSVQVEGRCGGSEDDAAVPYEDSNGLLPESTSCARLPAMTFGYSHVIPYTTGGGAGVADLTGYEGFDERIRKIASSPPHSVDEEDTDLFDINSDALPDVLVTAVGLYGNGHGVFFNSPGGVGDSYGAATPMSVSGVLGASANTITLKNFNVNPLDLDGDATIDLLHMPKVATYAVYTPIQTSTGWTWKGREVTTASGQSPKIDFGKDTLDTQVMDVDFDGLVDLVISTGTEMQTFLSLGRYAKGDGQFGQAKWTSAATAQISNEPVRTCVPWSATPIRFSDPDITLADMNSDGINDIVRIRQGDVRYWPGRGNGFWGTGLRDDCPSGTYGSNRHVTMSSSPQYSDVSGDSLRLDDVNGDGLTDLVQVRYTDVDIWLNVDGASWTERHIIKGTPASPSYANRVRLVDVNGSGTRDILWGNGGDYRYIDLDGGERPWMLVRVDNGLGKTTDVTYSTSTAEMLAADKAGDAWTSRMPIVAHVVKTVVESDNLMALGDGPASYVTDYTYRDPVFEGRQREFRGFRTARAKKIGDGNSPTDITESTFLLGECADEDATDGIDWCSPAESWRDNRREALKGLPIVTEKLGENGTYLSTEHTQYRLRQLYTGLDGRAVRHAFEAQKDTYLYGSKTFVPASATATQVSVKLEIAPATPPSLQDVISTVVPVRSTTSRAHLRSESIVDWFGNRIQAIDDGCYEWCPESPEQAITTETTAARPSGDPTGWLWRTETSKVTANPQYFLGELKKTVTTYLPEGVPQTATQYLDHTVALDRFNPSGGGMAPNPADMSQDGTIAWNTLYDDFGNIRRESGPNGRCRDLVYDSDYAQLPTGEVTYKSGCDTANPLSTSAVYDRGLGLVTLVNDIQGQPTPVRYDGFGRLISLTKPHPLSPGLDSGIPSIKIEYFLPTDLGSSSANPIRYSLIHTSTQDGYNFADANEYLESWAFVDGMGRTRVTLSEADIAAGDGGAWIASGLVRYDKKGAVQRKHREKFWGGSGADPKTYPLGENPGTPARTQQYDAFGRETNAADYNTEPILRTDYHALGSDLWDGADQELGGQHDGTYASERKDGHGRTISTIERFKDDANQPQTRETVTTYLPTGEPLKITRKLQGTSNEVVRWMRYDSLGRMVLNVEPNTTQNFSSDPTTDPTPGTNGLKAWRYAYNDAGDLVGTSDARGCGVNFRYDGAGRLKYEDYSPCLVSQAAYTEPNEAARTGIEVLYHYDTTPPASDYPTGFFGLSTAFLNGRLVAVYDRASLTVNLYDGRGRTRKTAVRIAKPFDPGAADSSLDARYADRWYQKSFGHDGADREVSTNTGADTHDPPVPTELLSIYNTSGISTLWSHRGTVKLVASDYGYLVWSIHRDADGLINEIVWGDSLGTTTTYGYDERRRLQTVQTSRTPGGWWTNPPNYIPPPNPDENFLPTFQRVLQDEFYMYDKVGNPVAIRDDRVASQWPDYAKPVDRAMAYDDLYRLKQIDYTYDGGGTWQSPFQPEITSVDTDPRHAQPSPHVSFDARVGQQTYSYDWLGNTAATHDDANGFYDRSLGTITNGTSKPYQLASASNETTPGQPINREGNLATLYDAAGNLTRMNVRRAGPCLPTGPPIANCNQRLAYDWDEVGRLVRARRWDVTPANLGNPTDDLPTATPDVDLHYAYDAGDERVIKTAVDPLGEHVYSVYIFDTLELRRAGWVSTGTPPVFDYEITKWTEVPYLFANGVRLGRVAYEDDSPEMNGNETHVLLEIGDHLGSTSIVIDRQTSELVERESYLAYGGADSDYRPQRWNYFREDYRFTGKEEDVEVGLAYFGKRFYAPALNRWISPDPLAIHVAGEADLNVYAYVHGAVLAAVDPLGLEVSAGGSLKPTFVVDNTMKIGDAAFVGLKSVKIKAGTANPKYNKDSDETRVELRYLVTKKQGTIRYNSKTKLSGPDKYVPTRTLQEHEVGHVNIAEKFFTEDNLKKVLQQADIEMEVRASGNATKGQAGRDLMAKANARAKAAQKYIKSYYNFVQDRALHTQANKAGAKDYQTLAPRPEYVDPETGAVTRPTDKELNEVYKAVTAGVPGAPKTAVETGGDKDAKEKPK